jgi:phosphoglucomutase
VAEKVEGTWRIFTGDEIGIIFSAWIWSHYSSNEMKEKYCMITTAVSSRMLKNMALIEGIYMLEISISFH